MSEKSLPSKNRQELSRNPGLWSKLNRLEFRDFWWGLLDAWEGRRAFRWWVLGSASAVALGLVLWLGVYPVWARRNAVRMARQWIEAGKPAYAAEIVRKALAADPNRAELWSLASELAARAGQRFMAVQYAHQAYVVEPENRALALVWASVALQADRADEARSALAEIPPADQDRSGFAQRLWGEIARRDNQLEEAKRRFEAAAKLEGGGGVNELPLGICLLAMRDPAEQQRGKALLGRLVSDPQWGAGALRALLIEAMRTDDSVGMIRWAQALRANPLCTVGDMPNCLGALSRADPAKYAEAVATLKRDQLATPESAAQLIGWLNQIGRSAEALEWIATLPRDAVLRPPLAVAKAETLRCLGDWTGLRDWTATGEWGNDLDFLRWTYGLCAANALGDAFQAQELRRTLQAHARISYSHALFSGTTLYSWNMVKDAEALWWLVATANNNLSVDALGTLARFYQTQRDADGQYRVFNQLHALHPRDDAVSNNLAYFAALTGNREQFAEQLARYNARLHASNATYQATYAFVLFMDGRAAEALKLLEPWKDEVGRSSAVTFAYGLALAGDGQKARAREILERLNPEEMTYREIEVIKSALSD